jgi:hypothetical protein
MAQQTRNPTGDGTFTGTWTGSAGSRWQSVDDHPDSTGADKLTHGTAVAGRSTFTFSAFTVPAGATITNVQVLYYDQKTASQAASWGAFLRVNSVDQATNDAHNPANATWTLRTATYTNNPATGSPWTVADVNGSGSSPLQGFGTIATDASPTCELASIQLVVNYEEPIGAEINNFTTMGQARLAASIAAATAAVATAISGSFNYNDGISPEPTPAIEQASTLVGERAIHKPVFQDWQIVEDFPPEAPPEQVGSDSTGFGLQRANAPPGYHDWAVADELPLSTEVGADSTGFGLQRAIIQPGYHDWNVADDLQGAAPPEEVGSDNVGYGLRRADIQPGYYSWNVTEELPQAVAPPEEVAGSQGLGGVMQRAIIQPGYHDWGALDDWPSPAEPPETFILDGTGFSARAVFRPKYQDWPQVEQIAQPVGPDVESFRVQQVGSFSPARIFIADDEIVPPVPIDHLPYDLTGHHAQRLVYKPKFQTWGATDETVTPLRPDVDYWWSPDVQPVKSQVTLWIVQDEFPTPVTPQLNVEEEYWAPSKPEVRAPDVTLFSFNDEITQPGPELNVEEEYWVPYKPELRASIITLFDFNEASVTSVEEAYWVPYKPEVRAPTVAFFNFSDELVPAPPATEDYWQASVPQLNRTQITVWKGEDERETPVPPFELVEDYWIAPPWVTFRPTVRAWELAVMGELNFPASEGPPAPTERNWLMDVNTGAIYWKLTDPFIIRIS